MMGMIIPRPDFERSEIRLLDGLWYFEFDDYNQYTIEEMNDISSYTKKILVPYPYQSKKSGIGDESFHDIVWYMKDFYVSDKTLNGNVFLNFGAVDYFSEIWLNGKKLGEHKGGYDSFKFEVSKFLKRNNRLVIRVVDKHEDQPRGKQDSNFHPSGCRYMRVTGIWQPVWIEKAGIGYIEWFKVFPKINGTIRIQVKMGGKLDGSKLIVEVFFYEGSVGYKSVEVNNSFLDFEMELEEIHLWSVDDPDIYTLTLRIENSGEIEDVVKGYFGLREISVRNGNIFLNNKPLYFQAVLDQGFYPNGIYVPDTPEDFLKDLKAVKDLGFNGVRAHQKPPDPRYLYFADRLGVVIWEEMGDWGMEINKKNIEDFIVQWRNIVNRDFNHPSIIAWVPFNERNDLYEDKVKQELVLCVYKETKNIDPTRLVIDTSGYSHVATDILDIHDYRDTTKLTGLQYKKLWDEYRKGTSEIPASGHLMSKAFNYDGQPIIISEFGGWGIEGQKPILNRPKIAYMVLPSPFDVERKYRDIVLAIAEVSEIAGYCYTQLYDVEGELNGFLTYDRKWKVDPVNIQKVNVLAYKKWLENLKNK